MSKETDFSAIGRDDRSAGYKTAAILKNKGVKSPSTKNGIKIKPGLIIVPKKKLTKDRDIQKFKREMISKYKLRNV